MLQEINGEIREMTDYTAGPRTSMAVLNTSQPNYVASNSIFSNNCVQWMPIEPWHSYPIYVCQDKTAKAIAVLKALESDKLLKCASVPDFIRLVEKIAALL